MKKIFALLVLVLSICLVSGCGLLDSEKVYGKDGETILVGNTAGQEGALASVGLPFNVGLQAALWQYNNAGGFNGAKVELKNYSDGGVQATGIANTKKLVEEIVTRLNVLGVDIQVSLFDNIKDALDLVAEHTGDWIDLDYYELFFLFLPNVVFFLQIFSYIHNLLDMVDIHQMT